MPLIAWEDRFNLGIASVDHEHRRMIETINALYDALGSNPDPETVMGFLGEIHARISAHFALEERIMLDRRYDAYADHKADHERLLDDIRDIMDMAERGGAARMGDTLAERVRAWFVDHARTKDARLHRMLG